MIVTRVAASRDQGPATRAGEHRRRLACLMLAIAAAIAATACGKSTSSQPTTGSGGGSRDRLVDSFAFNVVSSTAWTIYSGEVATYLLNAQLREGAEGVVGPSSLSTPPIPIRPRLLLDTVTVNDSLHGPPAGTDLLTPGYMAFDTAGDLWISVAGSHADGSVIEYTRAQINQSGSLTPSVTLVGTHTPLGLAFDPSGRLWVVDSAMTALLGYSAITIRTGGGPMDTVSMAGLTAGGATWAPLGLAFDASGNAWVSAYRRSAGGTAPTFVVAEFSSASLQNDSAPAPVLTLVQSGSSPAGYGPGMAFDTAGNLWTANAQMATLTEFTKGSLTAGANPAPAVVVSSASLYGVADISIDGDGLLFVGGSVYSSPGAGIFAYPPSALAATGSPTPTLSFMPATGVNHFAMR